MPTARCNYVRQDGMDSNVYASLLIRLDFFIKLCGSTVVYVNSTIWRAWHKLLSIQAEITLDWEPRYPMVFISPVLVKPERRTWRKNCYIISVWLRNKIGINRVVPNRGTRIGFHINLIQKEENITNREGTEPKKLLVFTLVHNQAKMVIHIWYNITHQNAYVISNMES